MKFGLTGVILSVLLLASFPVSADLSKTLLNLDIARTMANLGDQMETIDGISSVRIVEEQRPPGMPLYIVKVQATDKQAMEPAKALLSSFVLKEDLSPAHVITSFVLDGAAEGSAVGLARRGDNQRGAIGFLLSTFVLLLCFILFHLLLRTKQKELASVEMKISNSVKDLLSADLAVDGGQKGQSAGWRSLSGQHPLVQAAGYDLLDESARKEMRDAISDEQRKALSIEIGRLMELSPAEKTEVRRRADLLVNGNSVHHSIGRPNIDRGLEC